MSVDGYDCVEAFKLFEGLNYSVFEGCCFWFEIFFQEVGDDFGVGLGDDLVSFFEEVFFEFLEVFDDAVLEDGDLFCTVEMGMSIGVGYASVCCPAGVADGEGVWFLELGVKDGGSYFSCLFLY